MNECKYRSSVLICCDETNKLTLPTLYTNTPTSVASSEPGSLRSELVLLRLPIRLKRMLWLSTSLKIDKYVNLTEMFQFKALAFLAMPVWTSATFIKVTSGSLQAMLSCILIIGYQPFRNRVNLISSRGLGILVSVREVSDPKHILGSF